jgi:hypothetical protein
MLRNVRLFWLSDQVIALFPRLVGEAGLDHEVYSSDPAAQASGLPARCSVAIKRSRSTG